jgi:hypothetical protein
MLRFDEGAPVPAGLESPDPDPVQVPDWPHSVVLKAMPHQRGAPGM